jgi:RNA polymerase sigma factor (sigma-70 family)
MDIYNIKNIIDYNVFKCISYYNTKYSYKELYQIGYLGYLKAKNNFNPEYKKLHLSYVTSYIREELRQAMLIEKKYLKAKSISIDHLTNETAFELREELLDRIEINLYKLEEIEQKIIKECYLNNNIKRLKDIADELGLTKQRIQQIKMEACFKLKDILREEGYIDE